MDPLQYLYGLEQFGIKFGLDNIRALVERLKSFESDTAETEAAQAAHG